MSPASAPQFDCGRDFLAAWQTWRESTPRPVMFHWVAWTRHPVSLFDLRQAIATTPELKNLAQALASQWFGLSPGVHRLAFEGGRVLLTLCVGTNAQALADQLGSPRDAIFAAPGTCAVIGGGIAGASVAASMARRGWQVEVLDRADHPAAGASGLPAGLFAPHVSPDDAPLSRLSRAGIRVTQQWARTLLQEGVDWQACGVLERSARPDDRALRALPTDWPPEGHEWSRPAPAVQRQAAQLPEHEPALWHSQAGWMRPGQLVTALLAQPDISWRGRSTVARLTRTGGGWRLWGPDESLLAVADMVVVAAGVGSRPLLEDRLPLQALRGQVATGPVNLNAGVQVSDSKPPGPAFPVNGHGGVIPIFQTPQGARWLVGSTFQRGQTDTQVQEGDHAANFLRLQSLLPGLARYLAPAFQKGEVQGWAGIRATLPDRLPAVGPVDPDELPGLWACTGMGSRGLSLAPLCAELLAAWAHDEPLPLEYTLATALTAQRYNARINRKS